MLAHKQEKPMTKMYAIKNCSTVKKARDWLAEAGVEYDFHDYKKEGVDDATLSEFINTFGWENVVNRKGMTWRKLSEEEKAGVTDDASAIAVLKDKTSMIKRPIIHTDKGMLLGFNEAEYQAHFAK
jgi:Spx/MgsR family transcriptional regulator